MIAANLLAPSTLWLGAGLYAGALLWATWRAPWLELLSDSRRQHLLFGTILGVFLLWLVRRDFEGFFFVKAHAHYFTPSLIDGHRIPDKFPATAPGEIPYVLRFEMPCFGRR